MEILEMTISILHANQNNLKNISLEIRLNQITSVIGVSGSGKSSLIYGVIAREAKRREKIDSGNATCLDYAVRSNFECIENLPYCVTLKQRGLQESISSTLGTISGLNELLREEFVKYGEIIGQHGHIIHEPTPQDVQAFINRYYSNDPVEIYAVLLDEQYTDATAELKLLEKNDVAEAIFISSYDGIERVKKVSSVKELNKKYAHTILIPIKNPKALSDYDHLALNNYLLRNKNTTLKFNTDYFDIANGKIYQKKSTQLLSFNSSSKLSGKCKACHGHGKVESVNFEALIDHSKKLKDTFINIEQNEKGCYKNLSLCSDSILKELKQNKISPDKTMNELTIDEQKTVKQFIAEKVLKHQNKPSIGKFVEHKTCPCCQGTRLNDKANAVKLHEFSISNMLALTVDELYELFSQKTVHHKKMIDILKALKTATLGYLSLDRTTDTLSGGELQRVKFSLELTGDYTNLLYILDEPSTGLHPYNNAQMIHLIKQLRDKGNTVILSEHNADYIEASDHVVELGYGSGHLGGEIIYQGLPHPKQETELIRSIVQPNLKHALTLQGVSSNNINNENFTIPLNVLVVITGVSGSGKSSLIHQVLVPTLKQYLADKTYNQQMVKHIEGIDHITSLIELTQSQIGINSRSIVATYLDIFDKIRDMFALCEHAKELEFDKGDFSFNSSGACDTCKGLGETEEGTLCPSCLGTRYKPEITDIKLNGLSIAELLTKNISELSHFFSDEKLNFAIQMMERLGLSHLSLGRTTPTLSGGEAQRLKFAKSLIESFNKIKKGSFLFILDEPTSGLNVKDINKIFSIFDEILSYRNSIIVIEHNQHIIKNSDYVIDMGLGSGYDGGKNIFSGMVCDLIMHPTSLTAKALRGEKELFDHNAIDTSSLKEKRFSSNYKPDCHPFYLGESHFQIENNYAEHCHVISDNDSCLHFKTKESLLEFYDKNDFDKVSFNPYVTELYKHKIVPVSIKKKKIKALKKLNMPVSQKDYEIPEWDYRVACDNVNKAYSFGNGWITAYKGNDQYELFTRFVSIEHKMIGSPVVNKMTFNLYLNACHYCHGSAKKEVYDLSLIIADDNKSILEDGFLHSGIKKLALKTIITKFSQEGLFDFSTPFNQLSETDKHIFLFGFEPYKFLKPNGKATTLGDYIEWKGLYYYIYDQLDDSPKSKAIKSSQHSKPCPFCCHGFNNEIAYYTLNDKNITEIM